MIILSQGIFFFFQAEKKTLYRNREEYNRFMEDEKKYWGMEVKNSMPKTIHIKTPHNLKGPSPSRFFS